MYLSSEGGHCHRHFAFSFNPLCPALVFMSLNPCLKEIFAGYCYNEAVRLVSINVSCFLPCVILISLI